MRTWAGTRSVGTSASDVTTRASPDDGSRRGFHVRDHGAESERLVTSTSCCLIMSRSSAQTSVQARPSTTRSSRHSARAASWTSGMSWGSASGCSPTFWLGPLTDGNPNREVHARVRGARIARGPRVLRCGGRDRHRGAPRAPHLPRVPPELLRRVRPRPRRQQRRGRLPPPRVAHRQWPERAAGQGRWRLRRAVDAAPSRTSAPPRPRVARAGDRGSGSPPRHSRPTRRRSDPTRCHRRAGAWSCRRQVGSGVGIQSARSGFLPSSEPSDPYGRNRMNAVSWWKSFVSCSAIASACAGSARPYA